MLGIQGGEGIVALDQHAQGGAGIENETSQGGKQHLQMRIAREGDDFAVKFGIELVSRAKIAGSEADVGLLYDCLEAGDIVGADMRLQVPQRETFEYGAAAIEGAQILGIDTLEGVAGVTGGLEHAVLLQLAQRFTDRRPADIELFGPFDIAQVGAGRNLQGENALPEYVVDLVVERFGADQ